MSSFPKLLYKPYEKPITTIFDGVVYFEIWKAFRQVTRPALKFGDFHGLWTFVFWIFVYFVFWSVLIMLSIDVVKPDYNCI